jgi:hypothetical protein
MVNNSTNINETNSVLSLQVIEHKKTMKSGVGNLGPASWQAQKCGWVKLVTGIPTPFW